MIRETDVAIELVIFDCDGVLIDSEIISARVLQSSLLPYGVEVSLAYIIEKYVGRSYPTVACDIEKQFQICLSAGFEAQYREDLFASFDQELTAMSGVRDLLDHLNVPFCLASSSSPERIAQSLALVGLASRFGERVFSAAQVARGKPAPDLFLLAAQTMACNAVSCLVVEDSLTGIAAGLAAGMHTIRFAGGSHLQAMKNLDAGGAAMVFDDYSDFFRYYPNLKTQG